MGDDPATLNNPMTASVPRWEFTGQMCLYSLKLSTLITSGQTIGKCMSYL